MLTSDYIVVGSGITGATFARLLSDAGREVVVVERRPVVGGNVHDELHESGISIHTYGPHYFRTSSTRIWNFVTRFDRFRKYEAEVLSEIDGTYERWPVTRECVNRLAGVEWHPAFTGHPENFEQACLSFLPTPVYLKFVKGYTEKQWGVAAALLSANLAKRVPLRDDGDFRLSHHKHQGLPIHGYTAWMKEFLSGIPIVLNTDYLQSRDSFRHRKLLIFTGPIDEFFRYRIGRLRYRGQRREHRYFPERDYVLPGVQVNNPSVSAGAHVRKIEWKYLMPTSIRQAIQGTVVTTEIPYAPTNSDCYEYPFPDEVNRELYGEYRSGANELSRTLICGRLGEYRYYDMDQAIGRAMSLASGILGKEKVTALAGYAKL